MSIASRAAMVGAADTAAFLVARPRLFREAPGRAAGSVAFLGLWLVCARASAAGTSPKAAIGAAVGLTAANVALLAAHLRAGIATPRIYAGAALATVVLGDTLRRR